MAATEMASPAESYGFINALEDDDALYYQSIIKDQDDAEAVLQPAISAAASHLTSQRTPAIEKAAALEKIKGGGMFEPPSDGDGDGEGEGEGDGDGDTSPEIDGPPERIQQLPLIQDTPKPRTATGHVPRHQQSQNTSSSPWQAEPKQQKGPKDGAFRPSMSVLETAFGNTRNRSRSAGQEALKRLQKALPSLSAPSHLLPSRPTSFFSSFGDKSNTRNSAVRPRSSSSIDHPRPQVSSSLRPIRPPLAPTGGADRMISPSGAPTRPSYLRRVTSDESLLYHTLSRTSSLGNDDDFRNVREMVNLRFIALKDSLPEVPNFKMPSLPKMYTQARRSTFNLNPMQSSEALGDASVSREDSSSMKDPSTALDRVLEDLTGDLVIMGGYRGSILRSAESPHQQLWAPVKLGLNMRKANLEVGLEDEDEELMEHSVIPSGMLKHIGPIDISKKFIKKLRSCENARNGKLRIWDYGYDWRLSPPLLSRKLQSFLQRLPSNRANVPSASRGALVIAHSLGGLITRHAVNQRPDLFSGVLYVGVPQRCINILGPLRNGDVVLFNEKLLTAQVNFSMRTSFVLLPEDGFCFVDKNTGEQYPIDFYNPQDWIKWHLSPCVQPALPPHTRQQPSTLSSLLPNSLRARSDSKSERRSPSPPTGAPKDRTIAPQMNTGSQQDDTVPSAPDRERYMAYLTRTLAMIRKFRSELAHSAAHQEANAYPPLALMYGKGIPTVFAAQVNGRDAIRCLDAYDDLLFRPGDGVVLAKEAMLPEGYSLVRGGRICTERGHITMMGDLPAMGRAMEALVRGRGKGIGLGSGDGADGTD